MAPDPLSDQSTALLDDDVLGDQSPPPIGPPVLIRPLIDRIEDLELRWWVVVLVLAVVFSGALLLAIR